MNGLSNTLQAAARRNPGAAAVIDGTLELSYAELADLASKLAVKLNETGLVKGDRLLVVMQNRVETVLVYWATQIAGVIFTPVNWRVKPDELKYFLNDCGAAAICYCPAAAAVVTDANLGNLPQLSITDTSAAWIDGLRALQTPDYAPCLDEQALSVILYTSGTTGPGKGVPRSHRAERAAAMAHVAQNTYVLGERTLGVMPLYHTMGIRSLLASTLVNGLFVCQHKFDATVSLKLIADHQLTALYLVPTLYHDVLEQRAFSTADISSVRKLGFAGAPMTADLLRRVDVAFRPEIFVNHYGSSEIYTVSVNQNAVRKPGSAGFAGLNAEIRLVDLVHPVLNVPVLAGTPGQIAASMANEEAFAGYWKRPDADAKALVEGWYLTGDVGHFDEAGELHVTGRIDDMIISGGENILPSEVESILSLHPSVAEVVVAGLPDPRLGQKVTAFVRPNDAWVGKDALDAYCLASGLADFKRPKTYVVKKEIPKSPVGKVLRRVLIEQGE